MASPQCEDGYCKLANELIDALCRCLPGGSQGQVLMAVIRKTYGWNKKQDHISISQLVKATHLSRRSVIYSLKNLEAKKMVVVKRLKIDEQSTTNAIRLQKDYDKWVVQEMDGSYRQTIEKQRVKYHNRTHGGVVQEMVDPGEQVLKNRKVKSAEGVVQEMERGARNGKRVVQEMVNRRPFLAPTKDNNTKDKKQKTKGGPENGPLPLPEWLPEQLWADFKEHRRILRSAMTPKAQDLAIKRLNKFKEQGHNPITIVEQSIEMGWKGLFEPKTNFIGRTTKTVDDWSPKND